MAVEERKPWETADEVSKTDTPPWMLGVGLDTDMTRDLRPGSGSNIRLWMKRGTDKTIIFITDGNEAPVLYEHNLCISGDWRNWASCAEPLGVPCGLCKWANENKKFMRYKAAFFTVIDTSKYTDKAGKEHVNERKLMAVKREAQEIIKRKYLTRLEADQGLKGAMFKFYRADVETSPSTGVPDEFLKMVDLSTYPQHDNFDFAEILKPDLKKIEYFLNRLKSEKEGSTESSVPFDDTPGGDIRF